MSVVQNYMLTYYIDFSFYNRFKIKYAIGTIIPVWLQPNPREALTIHQIKDKINAFNNK
jgi:hypothetical protein